jgi:glycosyltransferase involved in cell wall biosynthesis
LGRLASLGRLNKETFDWNFVEVIRNATEILESEKKSELSAKTRNLLPKSGKKVFWLGGYNNWADTETLFEGLEKAMTKNKDFYFVSTGGEIKGLAKNNYQKFRSLINNSKFKDRFIFLGWISTAEIPALFKEVNLGICADLLCTETLTGARNRLNEMMKFGLPVLTSKGSEIAEIIKTCDAGEVFESGSANDLAEKLLKMLSDPKKYGENGQKYVKNYDFKTSVKAVSKYIKTPQKAPDYGLEINLNSKFSKIKAGWFYLKKNGLRKFIKKLLAFRY